MTLASRRKRRDSNAAQVNTWKVNSLTDANGSNLRDMASSKAALT